MPVKKYVPISCNFYDELEALATLSKPCAIRYREGPRDEKKVIGTIKDFFIRDKVEYLLLDDNTTIRLDYLIEVDGKLLNNYC